MNSATRILGLALLSVAQVSAAGGLDIAVTDSSGRALPDAVAYLTPAAGVPTSAQATVLIDQVDRRFVPAVSVMRAGTAVRFPNSDNVRHSVYSFSPAKTFTLKLYSGVPAEPVVFDKPGLVTLGCNIHDTMVAYVKVVETPYFGKSGGDGHVRIASLPAGSYQLALWHPWLAGAEPVQKVTVSATAATISTALNLRAPTAPTTH